MKDLRGDEWYIDGIPSHEFNKEELDAVWLLMAISTMGVMSDEYRTWRDEAQVIVDNKLKNYDGIRRKNNTRNKE